jgi:hypothetical protein
MTNRFLGTDTGARLARSIEARCEPRIFVGVLDAEGADDIPDENVIDAFSVLVA